MFQEWRNICQGLLCRGERTKCFFSLAKELTDAFLS